MKTRARLVTLITLGAILGFMLVATSCTGPTADKYTATTGITPGQTAMMAGKWWLDYEQAKTANEILRTQASPITSTKDVIDVHPKPQASLSTPLQVSPSPSLPPPPPEPPRRVRRPDANRRLQIAAN
jgi:hypothetical protein